jgi:hypothetical protein
VWSICASGFALSGLADEGITLTRNADYAASDQKSSANKDGDKVLLVCWVLLGNVYPITPTSIEKHEFHRAKVVQGYDSHFSLVRPATQNPFEVNCIFSFCSIAY